MKHGVREGERLAPIDPPAVVGRGCLDGTPLLDIKRDRCGWTPVAPPKG